MSSAGPEMTREEILVQAIHENINAINALIALHAGEFVGADHLEEARKRVNAAGGTLAYLAAVQAKNIAALHGDGMP